MPLGFMATSAAQLTASIINTSRHTLRQITNGLHTLCQLSKEAVILDAKQRELVEQAIRETCEVREWVLRAINVRTNHVHVVVSTGLTSPDRALNDFKAYATRRMRRNHCWLSERSPWADKGSKRHLWNERSIELAVDYVMNRQGDDLPDFD